MGPRFFPFAVAILDGSLSAHRDHPGGEDDHPAGGGGPPAINLGPIGDQPPPEPTGNDANPKPGGHGPGELEPPHHEFKDGTGIDTNVGDGGNKSVDENTPGKTTNADNPAPPPPKPGPDPGTGKNTPEIPVFLGPGNSNPPPGSSGPPPEVPQDSGHPDEGRNGYTEDTSCDDLLGESLINLLSNNGGNGGDASSGAATRQDRTPPLVHIADSKHVSKFRRWWRWKQFCVQWRRW